MLPLLNIVTRTYKPTTYYEEEKQNGIRRFKRKRNDYAGSPYWRIWQQWHGRRLGLWTNLPMLPRISVRSQSLAKTRNTANVMAEFLMRQCLVSDIKCWRLQDGARGNYAGRSERGSSSEADGDNEHDVKTSKWKYGGKYEVRRRHWF